MQARERASALAGQNQEGFYLINMSGTVPRHRTMVKKEYGVYVIVEEQTANERGHPCLIVINAVMKRKQTTYR